MSFLLESRAPGAGSATAGSSTAGASAVGRVYAKVAEGIISGALPASSFITEGEVAEALSVSRTPVREAFLTLQAHGLLTLFPKKGAVVTAVDDAETAELLQVRVMLETAAVPRLAERPQDIPAVDAELQDLIGVQLDAAAAGDLLTFARADHRFHTRIVDETRNRVIDDMYTRLGPRLERLIHRAASRDPRNLDRLVAEHRVLAGHLRAGDTPSYEIALRQHVEDGHHAHLAP
ncbi:GntR family transcriptional regulator [Cryobacterium sp. TMT1-21]|uniref:GntR family transcriptional regulator n=1 Tax=Cryobacterium shii TaxID=1259235 RepID=A0AAQ2C8G4_9MICO|nr:MULTISPECIES: GntR family transcriptional regulator [Cryobacterium]TFC52175.1 GntR family transcriptional regulator [Cryobacterium shii]TFC84728.1 GntR family transcriptional regulator [Cryobacterium sp. TmT2-59]TFD14547.1 GntR family transcriptional regulator [Cryobacterium sp. TMT4-10]TFD15698.1 GntR family transcriptional regulator [Cryobacterium sp. TMT1-21]TFD18997.1 GntR family transcriptional regulator [Cryobacterium sp. TMT2-23]